jgi:hypothetical protein
MKSFSSLSNALKFTHKEATSNRIHSYSTGPPDLGTSYTQPTGTWLHLPWTLALFNWPSVIIVSCLGTSLHSKVSEGRNYTVDSSLPYAWYTLTADWMERLSVLDVFVSLPSTEQAQPCLASEIRRDWTRSRWYGLRLCFSQSLQLV